MKTVNATGYDQKSLIALVKKIVERGEDELEIFLDNPFSASDVRNFLQQEGYSLQIRDDDGTLSIFATTRQSSEAPHSQPLPASPPPKSKNSKNKKTRAGERRQPAPAPETVGEESSFAVVVAHDTIGNPNGDLGAIMMKNFISALSQSERPPIFIALVNDGVKLAVFESPICDHLKLLEGNGVLVLVSGVCINQFGLTDKIGVGKFSDMAEIVELLNKARKVVAL